MKGSLELCVQHGASSHDRVSRKKRNLILLHFHDLNSIRRHVKVQVSALRLRKSCPVFLTPHTAQFIRGRVTAVVSLYDLEPQTPTAAAAAAMTEWRRGEERRGGVFHQTATT